jgi:uncharacterized protein YndB with AHSA1/START domain
MMGNRMEKSIVIGAPRERVWNAIADPAELGKWFVPNIPGVEMTKDENGKLQVMMGPMGVDFVVMQEVEPGKKVSLKSLPEKVLTVTFTLQDEGKGTRVTVALSGFERLPADVREDRASRSSAAWQQTLENLDAHLNGKPLPHPKAYVSPLFGNWRDNAKKISVERSIWIQAPRERVWKAITNADQLTAWFSPGTEWSSSGEGVGSKVFVRNPENGEEMYGQVVQVLDAPNKLVTRTDAKKGEVPYVTEWRLGEENGGTRLYMSYSGFELEPELNYDLMEQHTFGFGMMMQNIKAFIEGDALPVPGGF